MYRENFTEPIYYKYNDAKTWWNEKTANEMIQFGSDREAIAHYFQQVKGITYKEAMNELSMFDNAEFVLRTRPHEASTKLGFRFKKFASEEVDIIYGNLDKLASKIKENYKTSQEEAVLQIKAFMSNFAIV